MRYTLIDERLSNLVSTLGRWGDATFVKDGKYRGSSIVAHLRKEVEELAADPTNMEEIADCLHLLFHLAWQNQRHYGKDDLFKALMEKFEKNQKRTWGEPDKDGVIEHVRKCAACGADCGSRYKVEETGDYLCCECAA